MAGNWARVTVINRAREYAFAETQTGARIFVCLKYAYLLEDLELGDILDFKRLDPFLPTSGKPSKKCQFFAVSPQIIGYAVAYKPKPLPVTHAGESALAWKEKTDAQSDEFRAPSTCSTNSDNGDAGVAARR
jgi:hypothetical protein